jgi:hypothetical protein
VKFFFDNNLPLRLAKALNCLVEPDHSVVHLRQRFRPNTQDVEWLRALGREDGWVIISADTSILKNAHEREAWRESGHPIFAYRHGLLNLKLWDQATRLCHVFPEVIERSERAKPYDFFQIPVTGRLKGPFK